MTQNYIGVDLSKDWLDIFHPRTGVARIANSEPAVRRWLAGLGRTDILVFEATSLCDGPIRRAATAAGQRFCRLNPLHSWHFSRSLNLPKTDAVDARMLARIGAERRPAPSPAYDAMRAELAELVGRRAQLKRMETQEKNRLHRARSATVRGDLEAALQDLKQRIARSLRAIRRFIADHPALARDDALLRTIPGIGPVSSAILLAHMSELGALDRREAASLGGLAPRARDSGRWTGHRFIGDGRRHIRGALYLCAVSAMREISPFHGYVEKHRERGLAGKVIAIALARKLLTIANAVLRDGTPYKAQSA